MEIYYIQKSPLNKPAIKGDNSHSHIRFLKLSDIQ